MLTLGKLKVYLRYQGNGDEWLKTALPWEKRTITINEWLLIDDLVQMIAGSRKEIVFNDEIFNELCDGDETISFFKRSLKDKYEANYL